MITMTKKLKIHFLVAIIVIVVVFVLIIVFFQKDQPIEKPEKDIIEIQKQELEEIRKQRDLQPFTPEEVERQKQDLEKLREM